MSATLPDAESAGPPTRRAGKVWLVGAGPGDPELLTLKAVRALEQADVVAYDELVSPSILAMAPPRAERIAVGRRAHGRRHHDGKIHPLVTARALEGKCVVRLKGGDPMIFGRGGEEAEELASLEIPFEFVPGVSAALGAASSTHIPLTHRECASSVTFATAHFAEGDAHARLARTIPTEGTVVLYMGLARLAEVCATLIANGRAPSTPSAVVSRATLADQRVVRGTLATIASLVARNALEAPALLIVGDAVARAAVSPCATPPSAEHRR